MDLSDLVANINSILPLAVLMLWACLLLIIDLFIPGERKVWTALLAALGLTISLAILLIRFDVRQTGFNGMVVVDGFAVFLQVLFLGSGLVGVALAHDYLKRMDIERGEFYVLLLFSIGGMMMMSMASDLIMVFLSMEWLSIPLYILSGFARDRAESEESALKYFLLGAYAGGFVVYGIALVYGATATTRLAEIVSAIQGGMVNATLLTIGAALILIGVGFKVSAVPFHMWTPDVYQGAPTPVTAFMAVGAKAGGFAALLRVFVMAFPTIAPDLSPVLWMLAALTMFLGNLVAIAQGNIKRMLAYSSIAHAGYVLMGAVSFGQAGIARDAISAALFYLLAYAFTSFGAWAVVIALEKAEGQGLNLGDYAGLGRKHPALAAAMVVFMLSFTGIPPTLGFVGKFYLFRTAIEAGFIGLALIGVLTSLISAYYYLRIVVIMYMQDGDPEIHPNTWLNVTAYSAALLIIILSLYAEPLFRWASEALIQLF